MTNAASSTQEQVTISAKELEEYKSLKEKDAKAKLYAKKSAAKQAILAKMARDLDLTVSDEEIEERLAKSKRR